MYWDLVVVVLMVMVVGVSLITRQGREQFLARLGG
jgi:UPF0716 family protein affecting phage T7 exclusion